MPDGAAALHRAWLPHHRRLAPRTMPHPRQGTRQGTRHTTATRLRQRTRQTTRRIPSTHEPRRDLPLLAMWRPDRPACVAPRARRPRPIEVPRAGVRTVQHSDQWSDIAPDAYRHSTDPGGYPEPCRSWDRRGGRSEVRRVQTFQASHRVHILHGLAGWARRGCPFGLGLVANLVTGQPFCGRIVLIVDPRDGCNRPGA